MEWTLLRSLHNKLLAVKGSFVIAEDVEFKLEEVKFHIELLYAIQETGKSLTHINDPMREASYLLSAILNAFYSVTEICGGKRVDLIKEFKDRHPEIYAGSGKGGLRNTTVHMTHKQIDFSGYVPPKAGEVNFNFKDTPKLVPSNVQDGVINLNFTTIFYINICDELISVVDFCDEHLSHLKKLVGKL